MSFGAQHAWPGLVEKGQEAGRIERTSFRVDETGYAVLLGLRHMGSGAVELLVPERMSRSLRFVEEAGVENGVERNFAKVGLDLARPWIERGNHLADLRTRRLSGFRHLVDHDHIGKFDLLDQEIDQRASIGGIA